MFPMQIVKLLRVLKGVDKKLRLRGNIYVTVMFVVNSLQFLYICFQVIAKQEGLKDQGLIFCFYSFLNIIVIMTVLIQIIYYGYLSNQIDFEFQRCFMNMEEQINDLQLFNVMTQIYQNKNQPTDIKFIYSEFTDDQDPEGGTGCAQKDVQGGAYENVNEKLSKKLDL